MGGSLPQPRYKKKVKQVGVKQSAADQTGLILIHGSLIERDFMQAHMLCLGSYPTQQT